MNSRFSPLIPPFEGGEPVEGIYNAGPMLADDKNGPTEEDALMRMYTGASDEDMDRYVGSLEHAGFSHVWENAGPAYHALSAWKNGVYVYAYLTRATGVVRLIQDVPGSWVEYCSGSARDADGRAEEICQYALYYDPKNGLTKTTTNCGMFYIMKLADGSLFMVDGGDELQCSADALGDVPFPAGIHGRAGGRENADRRMVLHPCPRGPRRGVHPSAPHLSRSLPARAGLLQFPVPHRHRRPL